VMADEVGKWIPAGIALGIDENLMPIAKSMTNIGATIGQFHPTATATARVDASAVGFGSAIGQFAGSLAGAQVSHSVGGATTNNIYGQSDPAATSHAVANRQWARGV
jgi:hypothetical protein